MEKTSSVSRHYILAPACFCKKKVGPIYPNGKGRKCMILLGRLKKKSQALCLSQAIFYKQW